MKGLVHPETFVSDTWLVKRKFAKIILTISALLMTSSAVWAADGKGSQFGMVYGYGVPDAENTNQYHLIGVKGAAYFLPTWTAGGYYIFSDGAGDPSSEEKFRYSIHGVQTALHVPASGGETFFAVRVGFTKVRSTINTADVIFSPYHYGIATGYDFFIGSYLSLGFEGSLIHVQRGKTTLEGESVRLDSFNAISFMITAQLRL